MKNDEILAQKYVDGLLSGKEMELVERKMEEDESFKDLVYELQAVRSAFSTKPYNAVVPGGFGEKMAILAREQEKSEKELNDFVRRMAWAAAFLILVGLAVLAGLKSYSGGRVIEANDLMKRYEKLLRKAMLNEQNVRVILDKFEKEKKKAR